MGILAINLLTSLIGLVGLVWANFQLAAYWQSGDWGGVVFNVVMIVINTATVGLNLAAPIRSYQWRRRHDQQMAQLRQELGWYDDMYLTPEPNPQEDQQ